MLSTTLSYGLYLDSTGFADAKIEVLAFKVAIMPAFAIVTVCCSITSCNIALVDSTYMAQSEREREREN